MLRYLYHLTLVAALGCTLAFAQNMPRQQNPSGMPPPQQQPPTSDQGKMPSASTTDVQNDIQSALQKDPSLANANISVQVSGQNVELSGTVPTKEAKDTAEQIARSHSGGLTVKNHIKVGGTQSENPK